MIDGSIYKPGYRYEIQSGNKRDKYTVMTSDEESERSDVKETQTTSDNLGPRFHESDMTVRAYLTKVNLRVD